MENKRLEQTGSQTSNGSDTNGFSQNRDWAKYHEREEELREVSVRLVRLEQLKTPEVSPGQWKDFSQKLETALEKRHQGIGQRVRDRIRASDHNLVRWFWIVVALLMLALGALAIALSLHVLPIKPKGLDMASPVFQHEISLIQV